MTRAMLLLGLAAVLSAETSASAQVQSCGYLPHNRMRWWNEAVIPPTGAYTADDRLECFFEEPLLKEHSFDGSGGSRANGVLVGVTMRPVGNVEPVVDAQVHAAVLPRNAQPPRNDRESPLRYQVPLTLDFALPQRAVVIEFGLRYDEGYRPVDSTGRPGIDLSGIRLEAYDGRGFVIGSSRLDDTETAPADNSRIDYLIGFRDEHAQIARVALFLDDENHDGFRDNADRRPIMATVLVHRILNETLPPAAVVEGEVAAAPGSTRGEVILEVPFQLDRAAVIARGYRFDGRADPEGATIVDFDIDAGGVVVDPTDPRRRTVTLGAEAYVEMNGQGAAPDAKIYYSLIAWNSRAVHAFTTGDYLFDSGRGRIETRGNAPLPCSGAGCGSGGVVVRKNAQFTHLKTREWGIFDLGFETVATPITGSGLSITGWFDSSLPANDDLWADALFGMDAVVFVGSSVVADAQQREPIDLAFIEPSFYRGDDTTRLERLHFWTEDRNLHGELEALVAAVGIRSMVIDAFGLDIVEPSGPRPVRAMDVELVSLGYDGETMALGIGGGGVSTVPFGERELEHRYSVAPVYVGLKEVDAVGMLTVGSLGFVSYVPGQTLTAGDGGEIRNTGAGAVTIYDLELVGDTRPFPSLEIEIFNTRLPFSFVWTQGITLQPGEAMRIVGAYQGAQVGSNELTLRIHNTSMTPVVEMAIRGLVLQPCGFTPQSLFLGSLQPGEHNERRAIFENWSTLDVNLTRQQIVGPAAADYRVTTTPPAILRPGEAYIPGVSFSPARPGAVAEDRAATLRITSPNGSFDLPLLGIAVPPPVPDISVMPSTVQFGLVPAPTTDAVRGVSIRSVGFGPLTVQQLVLTGASSFSLLAPSVPVTLDADGGELEILIGYLPSQPAGTLEYATLAIASDDPDAPVILVPVTAVVAP